MRQGQQNRRGRGRGRKPQNPLSRNYESNGPDVKIRGTASHIAEKYATLARDALASGDSVTGENYLQHAEHYNRIIMSVQSQQEEEASGSGADQGRQQNGSGERAGSGKQPNIAMDGNPSGDGRPASEGNPSGDGKSANDNGKDEGVMRTLSRSANSGNGADNASGEDSEDGDRPRPSRKKGGSSETPDEAVT